MALQLPPPDQVAASSVLGQGGASGPAQSDPLAHRALSITWHAPKGLRSHGVVFEVPIPPVRSHFHARPAWIYLPPAYLTPDRPRLPVLELIGGQPGTSRAWLDGGRIEQRLDAWARAHGGLAPIAVMPDALGSTFAMLRGDRVIAVDANPDAGNLAHRVAPPHDRTITDVLRDLDTITSYATLRSYTAQAAESRLEVLASDDSAEGLAAFAEKRTPQWRAQ